MARGRCSRNPRETNGCRDLWLSPPSRRSHTQPRPDLTAPPGWLLIISNETAKPARESAPGPRRNLPHAGTPHLGVPAEPRAQGRRLAGGRAPSSSPLTSHTSTPAAVPAGSVSKIYSERDHFSHLHHRHSGRSHQHLGPGPQRFLSLTLCSTLAARQPKSKSLLSKCQSDYVHRWLKMSMASQLTPSKIPTPF